MLMFLAFFIHFIFTRPRGREIKR